MVRVWVAQWWDLNRNSAFVRTVFGLIIRESAIVVAAEDGRFDQASRVTFCEGITIATATFLYLL